MKHSAKAKRNLVLKTDRIETSVVKGENVSFTISGGTFFSVLSAEIEFSDGVKWTLSISALKDFFVIIGEQEFEAELDEINKENLRKYEEWMANTGLMADKKSFWQRVQSVLIKG